MLSLVFSIYLSVTILMCFFYIRIGISMFLAYTILVPFIKFFSFGQNIFPFLIIVALLINYRYQTLKFKPLIPFLFLYGLQLLIIPLHDDVPLITQLNSFRVDIMSTLLLPFAMINVMQNDKKALPLFFNTLLAAIIIATLYSILLTLTPGINPYIIAIMSLRGEQFNDAYAMAENQGRIFGRISGVFNHPMTNGLFLCLSILFILSYFFDIKKIKYQFLTGFLILLIFSTVFFIGVRTAIVSAAIGVAIFMVLERRFALLLYGSVGAGILFLVLQQIPGMEDFVSSIFDSQSSNVSGSSVNMRLSQLNGALKEIKNNPLFGKGYNWTVYYKTLRGDHPVLLAFESLLFVILCNNGFVGLVIWFGMCIIYYKKVTKGFMPNYSHIMLALITTYLSYSLITGEYGYMKYFLIFYSIMWMYGRNNHSNISINIRSR